MMPLHDPERGVCDRVSILVVLDWTMMHQLAFVRVPSVQRFNPCCIGLDNDAPNRPGRPHKDDPFQSLLYWIGQ